MIRELAKITSRGQVTIPHEVRETLNVAPGSKVVFWEDNGRIIVENADLVSLQSRNVDKDTAELIAFSNRQITRHHAGDQW